MDAEAVEALNAMGEPAVRSLVIAAEREDSALKTKLLQHSDTFPIIGELFETKYWDRYIALIALGEMGTNASTAIPLLKRIESCDEPMLAKAATVALVLIERRSIETIAADCFNYESTNCSKASGLLRQLGPHAEVAIPKAIEELNSSNERVRLHSAILLQYIGINSPICVPVFTNMLNDTNHLIRTYGLNGLANCGRMGLSAAPLVETLLDDANSTCRSAALLYFLRVIPDNEFEPYRQAVVRATNDINETVRILAEKVLREKTSTK